MLSKGLFIIVGSILGSILSTALGFALIPIPPLAAAVFGAGLIGGGICGARIHNKLKGKL
ncbi:MAG: hypothetical protein FWC91_12740 [Defluviitaleaceae bacterium]|nr:hypothetical protein [Defluviitaleaceae bacterium]